MVPHQPSSKAKPPAFGTFLFQLPSDLMVSLSNCPCLNHEMHLKWLGSMMNGLQTLKEWQKFFNTPSAPILGTINAMYPVGKVFGVFASAFLGDRYSTDHRFWNFIPDSDSPNPNFRAGISDSSRQNKWSSLLIGRSSFRISKRNQILFLISNIKVILKFYIKFKYNCIILELYYIISILIFFSNPISLLTLLSNSLSQPLSIPLSTISIY